MIAAPCLKIARTFFEGFYPQLFEFSVKMSAFYAGFFRDAGDVSILFLHLMIEIQAIEMFPCFPQGQIERQ